jgi:heme/copper-type cytochrome/quinol oxidase subunit 2
MKKFLVTFIILLITLALPLTTFAASVDPVEHDGNDANPNDYTPPVDCIRTTLPDSDVTGSHIYKFNNSGQLDPTGTNTLTLIVGIAPQTSYTQVLSWAWSGSYPLFAIIVKGGPAFNLYEYDGTANSDTSLVSPVNPSGDPADISHVSVILCPNGEPPTPPDGNTTCCIIAVVLLTIIVVLLFAVLVLLINIKCCCYKKHNCRYERPDC